MTDRFSQGAGESDQGNLPFHSRMEMELRGIWHAHCDDALQAVLSGAEVQATSLGHTSLEVEHLLFSLCMNEDGAKALRLADVEDPRGLLMEMFNAVHAPAQSGRRSGEHGVSLALSSVLHHTRACANDQERSVCGLADLLRALKHTVELGNRNSVALQALASRWTEAPAPDPTAALAGQISEMRNNAFYEVVQLLREEMNRTTQEILAANGKVQQELQRQADILRAQVRSLERQLAEVRRPLIGGKIRRNGSDELATIAEPHLS